jgi:hypothetical protein
MSSLAPSLTITALKPPLAAGGTSRAAKITYTILRCAAMLSHVRLR